MDTLEIDMKKPMEYINDRLGELKGRNSHLVLKRSLKRAVLAYQTVVIKETQKKYILKGKSIKANTDVKPSGDGMIFITIGRSKLITHYDQKSVTKKGRRKTKFKKGDKLYWGVRVMKKSKYKYIPNTFWIPSEQYQGILLRRPEGQTGKTKRSKWSKLFGRKKLKNWLVVAPSVDQIVQNPETLKQAEQRYNIILEKRIDHEIERILQMQ